MNKTDYNMLKSLLHKLMEVAPCHNGVCLGYQNCEFGENNCYGSNCAIEDVLYGMDIEIKIDE